ncbi:hypothetical protein C0J52_19436 [Blattella germanica]|nr:hypothetical protein C0J52_19436 [Blattella germanica]
MKDLVAGRHLVITVVDNRRGVVFFFIAAVALVATVSAGPMPGPFPIPAKDLKGSEAVYYTGYAAYPYAAAAYPAYGYAYYG